MAATWLVERGIGETRAALVEGGTILAARVDWHQGLAVGWSRRRAFPVASPARGAARSNLPMARWRWSMASPRPCPKARAHCSA
jgi:hypothetical protein